MVEGEEVHHQEVEEEEVGELLEVKESVIMEVQVLDEDTPTTEGEDILLGQYLVGATATMYRH